MNVFVNELFSYPLTIVELLTPMICASLIFLFVMIYMILYVKTRSYLYFIVFIVTMLIFLYDLTVLLTIVYGAINNEIYTAMILNKISNFLLLVAILFIPINTISFLKPNKALNIMNIICFITTLIFIVIAVVSNFISPDIFISINNQSQEAVSYIRQSEMGVGERGILYKYFEYLILGVIAVSLISTIVDIIVNMTFKQNVFRLLGNVLALFFISEQIFDITLIKDLYFNKIVLGITLFTIPRAMTVFTMFAYRALESIREQNILNNRLQSNSKIVKDINKISQKLNDIEHSVMDNAMLVFEIDKENNDAFEIISNKIESVINSNEEFILSKESKENIVKRGEESVQSMFEYFDKSRAQIGDNFKILIQTISNIREADFSNAELILIAKGLRETASYLKSMSKNIFKNITKYMKQFKEVNNITESIYEILSFIKEITNRTNLLSINAGIQASKAGIFGKSFSVVAKEIGTLAFESSKGTEQVEKMLTDIFAGLVAIENSSYTIEEYCQKFETDIKKISVSIDDLAEIIENHIENDSKKLMGFKSLEKYNDKISIITMEQNSIMSIIKDNINAIFTIQNNLGSRIEAQKQDIMEISLDIKNLMELKDDLDNLTSKIGVYSSSMHTDIENLSSIISTHIRKSSLNILNNNEVVVDEL